MRRGITAVRDCGAKDYPEFAARDAIKNGAFSGPTPPRLPSLITPEDFLDAQLDAGREYDA